MGGGFSGIPRIENRNSVVSVSIVISVYRIKEKSWELRGSEQRLILI